MGMLNEIYDNVRLYNSDPSKSENVEDKPKVAESIVAKAEKTAEASEKK